MNQREAVIRILEENNGIATLGYIYQNIFKLADCSWQTKTPDATIRRIVQNPKYFFKIKPGLWALNSYKSRIPDELIGEHDSKDKKVEEYNHSYYQGLLVELGNLKDYITFIPLQDKNKPYLNQKLGDVTKTDRIFSFSFEEIVKRASTVDVIWFNTRKMPHMFFEVEHSTDIEHSLNKFITFQDFHSDFKIVADKFREAKYSELVKREIYNPISDRVKFIDYDKLGSLYESASVMYLLQRELCL